MFAPLTTMNPNVVGLQKKKKRYTEIWASKGRTLRKIQLELPSPAFCKNMIKANPKAHKKKSEYLMIQKGATL